MLPVVMEGVDRARPGGGLPDPGGVRCGGGGGLAGRGRRRVCSQRCECGDSEGLSGGGEGQADGRMLGGDDLRLVGAGA